MSPEEENDEIKKARFYYETVVKADESSTKSYERVNSKISLFLGVLSTVIPILTGLGYFVISNTIVVPFFIFFVISLCLFIIALAKCVHLLSPHYFDCLDFGVLMEKYDKKSLDFIIFKISHSWEAVIQTNINRIMSFRSGLQRIVQCTIFGLVALVFSFVLLGIDYYVIDFLVESEHFGVLSESQWQLLLLIICLCIFGIIAVIVMRYISPKDYALGFIGETNTETNNPTTP